MYFVLTVERKHHKNYQNERISMATQGLIIEKTAVVNFERFLLFRFIYIFQNVLIILNTLSSTKVWYIC